jgi:glycerol-3-phosphate dehydrogenase
LARRVDDVLARRRRCLILDARAACVAAPAAARVLAWVLGGGPAWFDQQVADFTKLAQAYLPQG